jgi:hypothetical protein
LFQPFIKPIIFPFKNPKKEQKNRRKKKTRPKNSFQILKKTNKKNPKNGQFTCKNSDFLGKKTADSGAFSDVEPLWARPQPPDAGAWQKKTASFGRIAPFFTFLAF